MDFFSVELSRLDRQTVNVWAASKEDAIKRIAEGTGLLGYDILTVANQASGEQNFVPFICSQCGEPQFDEAQDFGDDTGSVCAECDDKREAEFRAAQAAAQQDSPKAPEGDPA